MKYKMEMSKELILSKIFFFLTRMVLIEVAGLLKNHQ